MERLPGRSGGSAGRARASQPKGAAPWLRLASPRHGGVPERQGAEVVETYRRREAARTLAIRAASLSAAIIDAGLAVPWPASE